MWTHKGTYEGSDKKHLTVGDARDQTSGGHCQSDLTDLSPCVIRESRTDLLCIE